MARHYGVAVVPARAGRPKDKTQVEAGVLLAERWIPARLRHQTFFSLVDLKQEIARLRRELRILPSPQRRAVSASCLCVV